MFHSSFSAACPIVRDYRSAQRYDMSFCPTDSHLLDLARWHVARSIELIRAQGELIRKLEQDGADAQRARALLSTMYRSFELMLEHRDAVEEATRSIARQNRRKGPRLGLRPLRLGTVAR